MTNYLLPMKRLFAILCGMIFISALAGCGNVHPIPTSSGLVNTPTPPKEGNADTRLSTLTETPTIALTSFPRSTSTPTETIPPAVTATVKPHEAAITKQNIHSIVQLGEFGRSQPRKVVWLPNGDAIAVASSAKISILSIDSLDIVQTIDPQTAYPDIAISPDGNKLFITDSSIQVWDLKTGQVIKRLGNVDGGIRSFAISANGRLLVIAGPAWPGGGDPDYKLEIIEIQSGRKVYSVQQYGIIGFVAVDPNGGLVASNSERGIEIFDGQTGVLLQTMSSIFSPIAFDFKGILVQGDERAVAPVRLWDARSGQLQLAIEDGFGSPVFSSDGKWLALWVQKGIIQIRDTASYQLAQTLTSTGAEISSVAFSPDGKTLAVTTQDGLSIWDIASGQITNSLTGFTLPIESIAFSSDSNFILGEIGNSLAQVWDIGSGATLSTTADFDHSPSANVQSPNGQIRAEEWIDDSIYPPVGAIRLVDTTNNKVLHELVGHTVLFGEGFTGLAESLAFNWDGSILASAGYDNSIRLWDVSAGKLLMTLPPHILLTDVNFSPDGRYVASSSWDGTIRLWGIPTP
jgi:WD40 repeat protein